MYFELAVNDGEFKPIKTIKSKKSNNKMNFRDWRFRIRRNREPTARTRYQEPPERDNASKELCRFCRTIVKKLSSLLNLLISLPVATGTNPGRIMHKGYRYLHLSEIISRKFVIIKYKKRVSKSVITFTRR